MSNILKITVKKEIFDKLASFEQKYIYVDANSYWIRRLALNSTDSFDRLKETQAFRTFDCVSVTCAKENAEYPFKSIKTGYEDMSQDGFDTGIVIWLDFQDSENDNSESSEIESHNELDYTDESVSDVVLQDAQTKIDSTIEELYENIDIDEESGEIIVTGKPLFTGFTFTFKEDDTETEAEQSLTSDICIQNDNSIGCDIKASIDFIIEVLGQYDNVAIVNRRHIIITSNGKIFGTKDRINIRNDEEIRVSIGEERIYDDTKSDADFIKKIELYLLDYVKSGHVFIMKDGCDIINTKNGRYLKMIMTKKLYLNR